MLNEKIDRREFINKTARISLLIGIAGISGFASFKSLSGQTVWQLDPTKCKQCGRCATSCVKSLSAVKCVHVHAMCGYCNLCGGYFKPGVKDLNTGAENQLCPTNAILRKYVENPYFQYDIDEDLCIGCGKCVKGCGSFGNGSLQLQIRHNLCDNCNECAIARDCPADAFSLVPIEQAYLLKGIESKKV